MSVKKVKAYAPASIGNLAVGFDCLGAAVNIPGDTVSISGSDQPGMRIVSISGDGGKLPLAMDENVVGVVINAMAEALQCQPSLDIHLHKGMALNSGLGSSAASSVAAAVAMNAYLDHPFSKEELLPFCLLGEKAACGAGHADNAAPSLLGGITLIRDDRTLDVIHVSYPDSLYIALVHPDVSVPTREARKVIPKNLKISTAIEQWRHLGAFLLGMEKGDMELIKRGMKDVISEPNRKHLIPHFDTVKESAIHAGAIGCSLSGSGPTLFALCESETIAENVSVAMQQVFSENQIRSQKYVSPINGEGAKII